MGALGLMDASHMSHDYDSDEDSDSEPHSAGGDDGNTCDALVVMKVRIVEGDEDDDDSGSGGGGDGRDAGRIRWSSVIGGRVEISGFCSLSRSSSGREQIGGSSCNFELYTPK
jgi:hypothetical protein